MVSSTRQSARLAEKGDNEPTVEQEQTSPKGTKRKADAASPTKGRGAKKAEPEKKQKTLEETIEGTGAPDDIDMIEAGKAVEGIEKKAESKGEEADQNGKQVSDEKEVAKQAGEAPGSTETGKYPSSSSELIPTDGRLQVVLSRKTPNASKRSPPALLKKV